MKNNIILKINNLSVGFRNAENVLSDFSLDVYENDKIAVIGETGSGKSIMLCAVLGLLPPNAKISGEVYYDDVNLLCAEQNALNDIRGVQIAYVPQGSASSLNPLHKIGTQVGEPLTVHKICDKKTAWNKAVDFMRKLNIGDEEKRAAAYPHTFSGGMRQRALIAMGISTHARLILADEPTKGLDLRRVAMVEESFAHLADRTYICVTHDLNFAQNVSERLCIMYSSELVEEGKTSEVFSAPLHPYTVDIIAAMPENGLKCSPLATMSKKQSVGCRYYDKCTQKSEKCLQSPPLTEVNGRRVRCWKYAEN